MACQKPESIIFQLKFKYLKGTLHSLSSEDSGTEAEEQFKISEMHLSFP